jgi:hypothetical protein
LPKPFLDDINLKFGKKLPESEIVMLAIFCRTKLQGNAFGNFSPN